MVGPGPELDPPDPPLPARCAHERLDRRELPILEDRSPPRGAPRDQVVELAAIEGLPTFEQRVTDGGSQLRFHDEHSSCGDCFEQMCNSTARNCCARCTPWDAELPVDGAD